MDGGWINEQIGPYGRIDRQMDPWTDKQMDRCKALIQRKGDRWMNESMEGQMDGWIDVQTHRQMNGCIHGRTDGQIHKWTNIDKFKDGSKTD